MTGIELIAAERLRQVTQEGWTPEHDDAHMHGELRDAAICYAMFCDDNGAGERAFDAWPWEQSAWKPGDDPVRTLVKAGALIAAEIDRLQRMGRPAPSAPGEAPTPAAPVGRASRSDLRNDNEVSRVDGECSDPATGSTAREPQAALDTTADANAWNPQEAIYAFMAWLTTRPEVVTFSSYHSTSDAVALIRTFSIRHRLAAPRDGWERLIVAPADPAPRPQDDQGVPLQPVSGEQLLNAVRYVVEKFEADEAAGYQSRDRQFAIEVLRQALNADPAALRRAGGESQWLDIATAPDYVVLVFDEGYIGKAIRQEDGRWLDIEVGRSDAIFDPAPTHWMKLPSPPKGNEP